MSAIRHPIKLIAIAGLASVIVLLVTTWVSHQGYYTLLETGADEERMQRLRSKIWDAKVTTSASGSSRSNEKTGNDVAGQVKNKSAESITAVNNDELLGSIREAIDSADLVRVLELANISERAKIAVAALENQSKFLERSGRLEAAAALLASDGFQEQKKIYDDGVNRIVGLIHEDSRNRIENQKNQYRLVLWVVPLAALFLSILWVAVIRNLRKWGREFEVQQQRRAVAEAQVKRINQELEQRIDLRTSELRDSEKRFHHQAYFDELTGLPNRRSGLELLGKKLPEIANQPHSMLLMIVDLDDFKRVNDTLGHGVGDSLLLLAARRIRSSVREDDTVVRLGGDEFMVVADITEYEKDNLDTGFLAERILDGFSEPFSIGDGRFELNVSPSVGVAIAPQHGDEVEVIMRHADMAMYAAKYRGRNCYHVFDSNMNEEALSRLNLESKLRRAVENDEFSLHYQPQIDLRNGDVVGVEALIRWTDSELGAVSPMEFIPVAEETGLILPIGEWVLNAACSQASLWHESSDLSFVVAVNVSSVQLRQPNFFETVERILRTHNFEPCYLELELTESALLQDIEVVRHTLGKLRSLGVRLSLDDFGTGYSALNYLKRYCFDILKIDRSYIAGMQDTESDATLVQAIITMAHGLDMKIVGEGTETSSQCDALREYGCDVAQGYFYSKPLPSEEFAEFVEQWSQRKLAQAS